MKIFEIRLKVYLLKNVPGENSAEEISKLIDQSLFMNEQTKEMHEKREYAPYTFNSFFPIEKSNLYKEGNIYTIIIRTISEEFKNHCENYLSNCYTETLKALSVEARIFREGLIEKVYSISPALIKTDSGYWRNQLTLQDFERLLKENLYKKYKHFYQQEIDESVELYTHLQFDNRIPVAINYKGKKLLGDKVTIQVASNEVAQTLFFMALGVGILNNNARGSGYLNAKFY
ncbi:CRISPR-associated endoribonuclease Cas6 [Psychrobacillus sp. NPDC093180]|uniref:CRISPR-associated endoribonuclease Cas6 n=1 Tax=Psychrobacillus sp. NPDC093180 TaxID=3364489 RepID=UPI00381F53C8